MSREDRDDAAGLVAAERDAQVVFMVRLSRELREPLHAIYGLVDLLGQGSLSADQRELLARLDGAARRLGALAHDLVAFNDADEPDPCFARPRHAERRALDPSVGAVRYDGRRVLVVDAREPSRFATGRLLEGAGCQVVSAESGEKAAALLGARSFDLVLLDCNLADRDGRELVRRLRRGEGEGQRTPVVALTAAAIAADVERARDAGLDAHLGKPVGRAELLALLGHYLAPSTQPRGAGPGRVLVVDDEAMTREVTAEMLDFHGFAVTTCADGASAAGTFREVGADVVIVDVRVPGMSGPACLAAIRELDPHVQGMILSGLPPGEVDLAGLPGPEPLVVSKPVAMKQLVEAVSGLVRARRSPAVELLP